MTPEQREECQRFVELQRAAGFESSPQPDDFEYDGWSREAADVFAASAFVPVAELLAENAALLEQLKSLGDELLGNKP